MAQPHKRYTEEFKRQAVARIMAAPSEAASIARELGVPRSTLYDWRKQFAAPPPPLPACVGEGAGGEGPGGGGPGGGVDDPRLRQTLLDAAFTLADAVREAAASAPLNQLSTALSLIIDRLLKLDALASHQSISVSQEVIRIAYLYPDGTEHSTPPWAEGDPAFEEPVLRGRVRSPFWEDRDGQADDPGDGSARG